MFLPLLIRSKFIAPLKNKKSILELFSHPVVECYSTKKPTKGMKGINIRQSSCSLSPPTQMVSRANFGGSSLDIRCQLSTFLLSCLKPQISAGFLGSSKVRLRAVGGSINGFNTGIKWWMNKSGGKGVITSGFSFSKQLIHCNPFFHFFIFELNGRFETQANRLRVLKDFVPLKDNLPEISMQDSYLQKCISVFNHE